MQGTSDTHDLSALLASREEKNFAAVQQVLAQNKIKTDWAGTGARVLDAIRENPADLLIMEELLPDMTARQLTEQVAMVNPFVYCVVAGSLDKKAFHQLYEGYGVLMQLPSVPKPPDIEAMLDKIRAIAKIGEITK